MQATPSMPRQLSLRRFWAALAVGAAIGAGLGAWGIGSDISPVNDGSHVAVNFKLLGFHMRPLLTTPEAAHSWESISMGPRSVLGAVVGLLTIIAVGMRSTAALSYGSFRALEAARGIVLGGATGALIGGLGFALVGAIVERMLNQPSWPAGRGAIMGAGLGSFLGILAGAIFGVVTTLSGAQKRYEVLRATRA